MSNISDLTVEARYHKDIEDVARRIEQECIDFLRPAPKGIYSINRVEPVMVDGIEYFTKKIKNGKLVKTVVSNLGNLTECIYTEVFSKNGSPEGVDKVVIPKAFMLNKEKYLSSEPILPYRGIKLVKDLANVQIDNFIRYPSSRQHVEDLIQKNLIALDENLLDQITCDIKHIYSSTEEELNSFLGRHNWNLYFIRTENTELKIERSIDWRAFEYERKMESGEWQ
jgi:hypothetical protein